MLLGLAGAFVMVGCDDGDDEKKEPVQQATQALETITLPSSVGTSSVETVNGVPQEPSGG